MQTETTTSTLLPYLSTLSNARCAVAVGGAHAKGGADTGSDLDFHIILENPKIHAEIVSILTPAADDGSLFVSEDFEGAPYGGVIEFRYKGTPVEITVQTLAFVERRVEACLEGKFEIIPQTWTSNGYYTFMTLSELDYIMPIFDPDGMIAGFKEKVREYPEKLGKAIIGRFYSRVSTWLENFHYDSAIDRGDILFTAPIVLHTMLDMVQVIYALNRQYFRGDKKLIAGLSELEYCPVAFLEKAEFLLCASSDVGILREQRDILRGIRDELRGRMGQR